MCKVQLKTKQQQKRGGGLHGTVLSRGPIPKTCGERVPHPNRSRLAGGEVGSPVEALVANNGDLLGLVVGWREPDYSGAVASAPSSESHTSDCR